MGQFKPMVKMMTTEPTVELKLKKGGHVSMPKMNAKGDAGHKKMANGGALGALAGTPALIGRPAVNAPVAAPGRPSMAARRKAMAPSRPMSAPAMAKKGGKMEGGESKSMHASEMKKMGALEKELKSHESKPASKGHKGLKTGGVLDGQGGYKNGGLAKSGIINTEGQGGAYRNTKMHTAEYTGKSGKNTGDVKMGNAGGYKTGGVIKANGGGYKKGGAAKKPSATGDKVVDSGRPVAMPQGRKKPSSPVVINELSGTFKKGGKATPAQSRLMKNFDSENATAMREAKAYSNEKYRKGGTVARKQAGGSMSDAERRMHMVGATTVGKRMDDDLANAERFSVENMTNAYNDHYKREAADNAAMSKAVDDALLYLPRKAMQGIDYLKNKFSGQGAISDAERRAIQQIENKGVGAISDREREASTTVIPARRRGGAMKK
jgi:hypothetical protein